jgi:hypothetical protein
VHNSGLVYSGIEVAAGRFALFEVYLCGRCRFSCRGDFEDELLCMIRGRRASLQYRQLTALYSPAAAGNGFQRHAERSRAPHRGGRATSECPRILGVLLDAVAKGLGELPHTKLDKLPRMADFALWATACETALWPKGTFCSAYSHRPSIRQKPTRPTVLRREACGRSAAGKDTAKGSRGHSSLLAAIDMEMEVVRPSKDGPERIATITKMRDGIDGERLAFSLEQIRVGTDVDGDPVTTCLVQREDIAKAKAKREEKPPWAKREGSSSGVRAIRLGLWQTQSGRHRLPRPGYCQNRQ